jgi:hypothetical protein
MPASPESSTRLKPFRSCNSNVSAVGWLRSGEPDKSNCPKFPEACLFCWENYRKDYSPTTDRRRFFRDYCAGRFVTVALLDAAWEECKRVETDATRSALFNQPENEGNARTNDVPAFDRLDDEGIADLYHRTLREYAQTVKRQSGVFV